MICRAIDLVFLTLLRSSPHTGRRCNTRLVLQYHGCSTSTPSFCPWLCERETLANQTPSWMRETCSLSPAPFNGDTSTTSTYIENSCQESDGLISLTFKVKFRVYAAAYTEGVANRRTSLSMNVTAAGRVGHLLLCPLQTPS